MRLALPRPRRGLDRAATKGGGGSSPVRAASPLEVLRARLARLLDRAAPRLPEELDLAEAVCALKRPKWPVYGGPVDLDLLRLALRDVVIDPENLHWLGGHELAKACRAAREP